MRLFLALVPALLLAQSDWSLAPQSERQGYTSEARPEGVLIVPPAAPTSPGNLMRTLDAAPYRGRAVRLRASVRLENPGPGDRAQLWLRVERPNGQLGFFDDMGDRPITSAAWQTYEIAGEVAPDARSVEFGIKVSGKARVWLTAAAFETAAPDADPAARAAIEDLYSRIDAAYAAGDADAVAGFAAPGAQVAIGGERVPVAAVLRQISEEMRQGARYRSNSTVTAFRGGAAEAVLSVNNRTTVTSPAKSQTAVSVSRDTWIQTPAGWRLKESVLIATHLETPGTGPDAARPVIAGLKEKAAPLPAGMAALGAAISGARIVALGQASYGTHEFAEINTRIIQYLVEQKGFTVVAIGANWAEARAIERYVRTGAGSAREAIQGLNAWPWETQELLELVEWMRRYNAAGGHAPVAFAGFDMQPSPAAGRLVLDYLKEYAPDEAGPAELAYSELRDPGKAAAQSAAVARELDTRHRKLLDASGPELWREARQAAAVAWQERMMQLPEKGQPYRSQAMAANIEWLAGEAYPAAKVVVWSHNANVAGASGSMAAWLRRRYGRQLYAIGYAFAGGELRAVENGDVVSRPVAAAAEGTGDAVLGAVAIPRFFVDLTRVPAESALGRWLAEPHLFHQTGVMWSDELVSEAPGRLYDGLIFVQESHPTRDLP